MLGVKLDKLDEWNARRAAIAAFYQDALAGLDGLTLPHVPNWADPAWHLYVVRASDRDRLAARLAEAGVQTLIHYPIPPHRQQAYADMGLAEGSLPIAEALADRSAQPADRPAPGHGQCGAGGGRGAGGAMSAS